MHTTMKSNQRVLIVFLVVALLLPLFTPPDRASAEEMPEVSFGQVLDKRSMEIGPDVEYTWQNMELPQGQEKVHFVEFDPRNPSLDLQPGKTDGKVYGMQGVTKMANDDDRSGNRVIAAINADFYDMSTGVPLGLFMGDGEILTSPPNDWYAFGLKNDGTTIYGSSPRLERTLAVNGTTLPIHHINRMRFNSEALILFTPSFHTSTMTNDLGDEVELEVLEGEVMSGQTMRLRVAAIHQNKGNTPLTEGRVVLSASGQYRDMLSGLQIGDEITASFALEEAWRDVKMAVGGQVLLVKDGVVQSHPDPALFPRVAIGTKADGTVVMLEVDGRAPGFSEGVTFDDLALILKDMGVVDALLLDGGGSATFVARLPGEPTRKILNRPSDGAERKTANGILLVNKAPESAASKLVVQPNLERVLVGSSFRFKTAAVDPYTHPAPLGGTPSWSVNLAAGSVDASGLFIAGNTPGMADISVSAGGLTGTGQVEIVKDLTHLKFPDAVQTFTSGDRHTLSVTALRNGQVIQADNRLFEWRVEGPIGTIDENGTFTATNETEQSGKITVRYQGIETSMDVHVGLPPVILEDFENGLDRYLPSSGDRFVSASLSEETNEDFVRFGNKSAKLEYDFTGTIGTSGAYIKAKDADNYIEIPGYPKKISMWVYGDGKKHWLRSQVLDGNNGNVPINFVDEFVGVDFTGWRYLEAEVPQGRPLPLRLAMPARYMETKNDNKTAGVLYIDQIRALYGPANDDLDPPMIKNISPADGSTVNTNTPKIQAFGEDFGYDPAVHPGTTLIDPDKIRMYVDGVLVPHTLYPPKGQIHYTPSIPLTDGVHAAKLKIRDLSGNLTEKEWAFTVDTGSSKIIYDGPDNVYAGNTYKLDVRAVRAAGIRDGYIEFGFDPAKSEELQVIRGNKLTETQLQSTIDPAAGTVRLDFNGLETSVLTDQDVLAQIQFKVKSTASDTHRIAFRSGAMKLKDQGETSFGLYGLPVDSAIKNHLHLEWNEDGIVQGLVTSIQVTDEAGAPVAGAKVVADGIEIGMTDASGKLETNDLTDELKEYKIQAIKGDFYSPVLKFKVSPLAGSPIPSNISVTMGADPAVSRAFTWHTHPDVKQTVVEIVKKSEFTDFSQPNVIKATGSDYLFNTWDIGTVRVHKAVADGLEPGTEYVYRVGDGAGNTSSQGAFRTAETSGESFEFLYFADSQATNAAGFKLWGDLVKKAAAEHPDSSFLVHTGDMVEDGYKENEWKMWFDAAQQELLKTTVVSAVGNHEVTGPKKNDYFLAHFNHPQNGVDSLKGSNYSFDYQNAHFAVLNSEYDFEQQRDWLRNDLASTDKKWKIVFFHRGPYGSIYDSEHIRNHWTPVLDEFEVDLALNGHDHVYMRSYSMKGNQPVADGEGTTYVIAGSTGPKFYQVVPRGWQKITDGEQVQMYASIEIEGDELHFVTKAKTDRIVDQFTLTKTPPQSVILDRPEAELTVGRSLKLNAAVLPERAYGKTVTWSVYSSSTDNVVTVDTDGWVTALNPGSAIVRASTVVGAVYADSQIEVTLPAPDVVLTGVDLQGREGLKVGETDQTVAEAVYSDNSRLRLLSAVSFSSSDPNVASINVTGKVIALKQGQTVISAVYGGLTDSYTLQVESPVPVLESIKISGKTELTVGDTERLSVAAKFAGKDSWKEVTEGIAFRSDNETIASVDATGTVIAKQAGHVRITATYQGFSDKLELQVNRNNRDDVNDDGDDDDNDPSPGSIPEVPEANGKSDTGNGGGDVRFTVEKIEENGKKITNVTISNEDLKEALDRLSDQNTGQRQINIILDHIDGESRVEMPAVALMNQPMKDVIVAVKSEEAGYSLPLKALDLDSLAEDLNADTADLKLVIVIEKVKGESSDRIADKAGESGGKLLSYPFEFSVMVKANGNTKEIDDFGSTMISRTIVIAQSVNPAQTTAVLYDPVTGGMSFVPAVFNTVNGKTEATIMRNGNSIYAVVGMNKSFSDVSNHWSKNDVELMASKLIVKGVSDRSFGPDQKVTRAEFAALVVRGLGLSETKTTVKFNDVADNDWFAGSVGAAVKAGIVQGFESGSFKPDDSITREQMAVMLTRALAFAGKGKDTNGRESQLLSTFRDRSAINGWAQSAVAQAVDTKIMDGMTDGSFVPNEFATRAQAAVVLKRTLLFAGLIN